MGGGGGGGGAGTGSHFSGTWGSSSVVCDAASSSVEESIPARGSMARSVAQAEERERVRETETESTAQNFAAVKQL